MSVQRQFGTAVAWMALGNWTEQAVNFVVFVILARLLGAEAFGLLAMAAVFVILSEFLVRESFGEFLISTGEVSGEKLNTAFWLLAAFGGGLALLLFFLAEPIAFFYGQAKVAELIRMLCVTIPIIALTAVPVAILRREMRFRILSIRAIVGVIAGGIVGIALALTGAGVLALVGQRLVQVGVNVILAWGAVKWRPGFKLDVSSGREMFRLGSSVIGLRAGEIALTQLPSLIVGAVLGPVVLGLFTIAWRLVDLSSVVIAMPIRQAAQPAFAALDRVGQSSSVLLAEISKVTGLLVFPAFAAMSALSAPLLEMLFGSKWIDAIPILAVLAPLGAYLAVERQHQAFVLSKGRAFDIAIVTWIEVALISGAFYYVAPSGLDRAIVCMLGILALFWTFRFRIVSRLSGTPPFESFRIHLVPIGIAIATYGGISWTLQFEYGSSPSVQFLIAALVGALIIGTLVALFCRDRLRLMAGLLGRGSRDKELSINS